MLEGTENFIMQAQFELDGEVIMLSDTLPGYPVRIGENVALMIEFEDIEKVKAE